MANGWARAKTSEATLLAASTGKWARISSARPTMTPGAAPIKASTAPFAAACHHRPRTAARGVVESGLAADSFENSRLRPEHPAHGAVDGPGKADDRDRQPKHDQSRPEPASRQIGNPCEALAEGAADARRPSRHDVSHCLHHRRGNDDEEHPSRQERDRTKDALEFWAVL